MIKKMKPILLYALVILFSLPSFAATDNGSKAKRGKHWYEQPEEPKQKEPKQKEPKQKEPGEEQQSPIYIRPVVPPMAELMKYHPQQIKKLFTEVHEYHVMQPTEETAVDLLVLENVLTKKSRAASAVKYVTGLKNPELTGVHENPAAPAVKTQVKKLQNNIVRQRLIDSRKEFALLVFTSKTCGACLVYKRTMIEFRVNYNWTVKEIDIDKNRGFANKFGVYGTPTTFLVRRNSNDYLPVAQGAEPLTKLVMNTSQGIRLLKGEITEEQWLTSDVQTNSYFDPEFNPN